MKARLTLLLFLPFCLSFGQKPEDFGFRHFRIDYREEPVDILIKSRKGDEETSKPLFFYCQGSLPQPLIKTDGNKVFGTFSFQPDSLLKKYHLAIVGKPSIPLIVDKKYLDERLCFIDSARTVFKKYSEKNLLDYYVNRNIYVVKFLQGQNWVSKEKIIVAGHSEGSTVAAKMACEYSKITHLIYSGGNPYGRIMAMIAQGRASETDSAQYGEDEFKYWQAVINDPDNMDCSNGDTYKATYIFSHPEIEYIKKLNIPVLVTYGTKDVSSPYIDLMRMEFIRNKKKNITFKPYIGLEHNYFPLLPDGTLNHTKFNWDRVAYDWYKWLE